MYLLFLIARIYPFFAIAMIIVCGQLGLFYFRRRNRMHILFSTLVVVFAVTLVLWAFYRGDLHSDRWMHSLLEAF